MIYRAEGLDALALNQVRISPCRSALIPRWGLEIDFCTILAVYTLQKNTMSYSQDLSDHG